MRRRLVLIVASLAAMLGGTALIAAPAHAAITHIPSDPGRVGLLRVCVIVSSADTGVCVHV
jgi:hypothetical protein